HRSRPAACPARELAATCVYGNSIDAPVTMRRDTNASAAGGVVDYFFHQDDLLDLVAITDGASGGIVERVCYERNVDP
ncbi:MAG: hypothetical protein SFZ24_02870, partial [Planctomycetota bacterium]|nr:hypothetical protein [Planctomycetota bacterium]